MLESRSALIGLTLAPPPGAPGATLTELRNVSVTALHGADLPGLPASPGWAALPQGDAIWTGPGQWLLLHAPDAPPDLPAEQRTALTGARTILELSGPRAAEILATLLPIDLHVRAFPPGAAASTVASHIPLLVWRSEEGFRLACYRSYGLALAEALIAAGRGRGLALG